MMYEVDINIGSLLSRIDESPVKSSIQLCLDKDGLDKLLNTINELSPEIKMELK